MHDFEVGDKVRLVADYGIRRWGAVGEVGTVVSDKGLVLVLTGVGAPGRWSHPVSHCVLAADEVEDMPKDTILTSCGADGTLFCTADGKFCTPDPGSISFVVLIQSEMEAQDD